MPELYVAVNLYWECRYAYPVQLWTNSFPKLFVPMMELSFSRPFVPGNIRMFPGTFNPWTIHSLEHSFPRNNQPRNIRFRDLSTL